MRKLSTWRPGPSLAVALLAVAVITVMTTHAADHGRAARLIRADAGGYLLPASQIISFGDRIGLLDTTTGAVYRLNGNTGSSSARLTWQQRVPPVAGPTSGLLELQKATFNDPAATFLVDTITGRTWILRERASSNGAWVAVDVFPPQ